MSSASRVRLSVQSGFHSLYNWMFGCQWDTVLLSRGHRGCPLLASKQGFSRFNSKQACPPLTIHTRAHLLSVATHCKVPPWDYFITHYLLKISPGSKGIFGTLGGNRAPTHSHTNPWRRLSGHLQSPLYIWPDNWSGEFFLQAWKRVWLYMTPEWCPHWDHAGEQHRTQT